MHGTIKFLCRRPYEFDTQHWEALGGEPVKVSVLIGTALCVFELPEDRQEIFRLRDRKTGEEFPPDAIIEYRPTEAAKDLLLDYVPGHWDTFQNAEGEKVQKLLEEISSVAAKIRARDE